MEMRTNYLALSDILSSGPLLPLDSFFFANWYKWIELWADIYIWLMAMGVRMVIVVMMSVAMMVRWVGDWWNFPGDNVMRRRLQQRRRDCDHSVRTTLSPIQLKYLIFMILYLHKDNSFRLICVAFVTAWCSLHPVLPLRHLLFKRSFSSLPRSITKTFLNSFSNVQVVLIVTTLLFLGFHAPRVKIVFSQRRHLRCM